MPVPPCPLYLIRHGETDWNAEGRLQGGHDVPLNALGRRQAADVARVLLSVEPRARELDFLCSPMNRARETMDILRGELGLATAYPVDERLKELTFGQWEGKTWREVKAADPERARARERAKWSYVPPAGESYAMLMDRVMPVFGALARPTVVVSHGGVMRAALVGFGLETPRGAESMDIWQGRVLCIGPDGYRWA